MGAQFTQVDDLPAVRSQSSAEANERPVHAQGAQVDQLQAVRLQL